MLPSGTSTTAKPATSSSTTCSLPARISWDSSCAFETNGADNLWISKNAVSTSPVENAWRLFEVGLLFEVNDVFEGMSLGCHVQFKFLNRVSVPVCKLETRNIPFTFAAKADETCNSPYTTRLIKGQEDFVHVWTLGAEGVGDGREGARVW